MPKVLRLLTLVLFAAGPLTAGSLLARQAPAADEWTALTTRLEGAALAGNTALVKDARIGCLRLLAATPAPAPARAALIRYTLAYADWRIAVAPALSPKEQSDLVDDADVQLNEAIKLDGSLAEAMGLLSAVYGLKISKNQDLGMTLGMQASELLGRAANLEPVNPRLLVLQGISQFHTPPEYGGSAKDAEATLRRALAAFAKESESKPWPNWGRFDAHAWLGQMLANRGDKTGARAEYESALAIAPDSGWVRYTLLAAIK